MKHKKIIGRAEKVDFPDLGFTDIDAKIDTGAYTSSLHCHYIKLIGDQLYCRFLDPHHPQYNALYTTFENFRMKEVRSSNGLLEKRFAIKTSMIMMGKKYRIEFTLTNRKKMKYEALLGSKFLTGRFIVDVSLKNAGDAEKHKG